MSEHIQQPLSPDMRPEARDVEIPLSMLPSDDKLLSQAPDASLVRSIAAIGVQQPIIVIEHQDGRTPRWEVAAGRRRIKAARLAGLESIPARAYKAGDLNPSLIALVENEQRSRNLKHDLAAVQTLINEGYTEAEIIAAVGVDMSRYRSLMRLTRLSPALMAEWQAGSLTDSTARAASKLTKHQQERLETTLEETGSLKLVDVKQAKRAVAEKGVASLDADLFKLPDATVRPLDNPLAGVSDEALLAELTRRGLTVA